MTEHTSDLHQLKNLGAASVNILHAIGVRSSADLQTLGPVEAYVRIKQRGIQVSKVMLYALQGALLGVHWNDLEPELKQRLLADASEALANRPDLLH